MPSPARPALRVLLACLLAGAVTLAGCGGDDPALSKREYIEEGNALQHQAAAIFEQLDGATAASPKAAAQQLGAIDKLIAGYDRLHPPNDWRDEHATMLRALRTMRQSMAIVSRASARNTKVITTQLDRFVQAQQQFRDAVTAVNASR